MVQRVILGGGLTGLTTAYLLAKRLGPDGARKLTLIEKGSRLGGWVDSRPRKAYLPNLIGNNKSKGEEIEVILESGPRSIRPRGGVGAARMLRIIQELDLESSILPVTFDKPAAKNRFILDTATSRLIRLPSSLRDIFSSINSPLTRALIAAILKEPFNPSDISHDESVDSLVRRRLGPYVADNLISAMVHGIYATDSRQLSVRSTFPILWDAEKKYGSIVTGMLRGVRSKAEIKKDEDEFARLDGNLDDERKQWSLYGLKGGLGTLTNRLEEEIRSMGVNVRLQTEAANMQVDGENVKLGISCKNGAERQILNVSQIISTLKPSELSPILPPSHHLPGLTYNPSTTVGVVNLVLPLPPNQVHPPGFGYLIPRSSNPNANPDGILGVVFDSTAVDGLESKEVSEQITKLTVMIGGPHWTTYRPDQSTITRPNRPEELENVAVSHLRKIFPHLAEVEPILVSSAIHVDCIPTYLVGHGQRLQTLHKAVHAHSQMRGKLVQLGSGYGGVGVNDCVGMAWEVVDRLIDHEESVTGLERWENWH